MVKEKAKLIEKETMAKTLDRIAHEIIEQAGDMANVAIVGIRTRGSHLAERIAARIEKLSGQRPSVGALDITLYRDDLTQVAEQPMMHATEIDFNIDGKNIILVDDVLYTGRTIRCALDALIDLGRPAKIQLAVLIDRGHRELPIRADYVGKNVPTAKKENVEVRMEELDGVDEVILCEKSDNG